MLKKMEGWMVVSKTSREEMANIVTSEHRRVRVVSGLEGFLEWP